MAATLLPAPAQAAPYMVSIMQDDNQTVHGNRSQLRNALGRMKGLGVEAVRATLLWREVAPGPAAKRKPGGFNGAKPGAYPARNWDNFDALVVEATSRGLAVLFNPTGPGPRWGHKKARVTRIQETYRPSTKQFGKFMRAVGRRYSGRYRDENDGKRILPRVSFWGVWNEPNQPGWLTPQGERVRGAGMIAVAPHLYRDLLVAGARALLATGHAEDTVLIGELAPLGSARKGPAGLSRSLRPGLFLPEMFCLNQRYRPYRGRAADLRGCGSLKRLGVLERFPRLGFAHHPYTLKRAPTKPEPGRDIMNVGNVNALPRTLDKIAARTGLLPPEMPIFFTEFGYQTLPPDPFLGVSHAAQAQYINEADFIAWRHPRIFSVAQFQLFDVPPSTDFPRDTPAYWRTYQSGLYTALPRATAKPSVTAYKFPLVVRRRGGTARIWGQVRFAPNGAIHTITLQTRAPGSSTWVRSGDPVQVTHSQGYFKVKRPTVRGASWRAVWGEPDFARFEISREAVAR